jgi:hypothetical protein
MINLSLWVVNQKRFEPIVDTIEGVTLSITALTDDLIQTVKECLTSEDMYLASADYGVSSGDTRFCDDEKLAVYLSDAWVSPEFTIDCEPSLKYQVGERVAEISGILEFIEAKKDFEEVEAKELADLEAEEKAMAEAEALEKESKQHMEGDDLPDTDLSLAEVEQMKIDSANNIGEA